MSTVLIVDDSALDRRIAGNCVEKLGLSAAFAENGHQALEMIASSMPDIVLTDLQMPELSGLELVKQVRHTYPDLPTILMTAWGSEEIAVTALREGAASYVPKKNLVPGLEEALRIVMEAAEAAKTRAKVIELFQGSESRYELRYQPGSPSALVSHLQDALIQMDFCDKGELIRVGTALTEAFHNAIYHGNLELDSALREESDTAYHETGKEREIQAPYRDRVVTVTAELTPSTATYIVLDEGPGFDPATLPDPSDPENLLKPSGRGIMLIRTFMDNVSFNQTGNEIRMVKRKPG